MQYFTRPSKSELLNTEAEIQTAKEFLVLIDERVKILSSEKLKLEKIIHHKKQNIEIFKKKIEDKSADVLKKYGLLGLKRISHFTKKSIELKLNSEYIAGVKYSFPFIIKEEAINYPVSITSFEVDDLAIFTHKFFENIIDLSKYIEAMKHVSRELNQIKRKLNGK